MSHYDEQYEEQQLEEAFKNAKVFDCTSDSRSTKELIEENARLHMELAKMRSWKEKVMNLISEKCND
jgi:hypothetical protein